MKRVFRTIPEGKDRLPKKEAPTIIMKTKTSISLSSLGEPLRWMAPVKGALNNVVLFVKSEQESSIGLTIEMEDGAFNRVLPVKPGNNALPGAISVNKGDRITVSFPEGASEIWLAAVFGEAE